MGVDADLNRLDSEFANQRGLFFPNQDRVGLQLDVEGQLACAADNVEQILAQQRLTAADSQEEDARFRHLGHQIFDFVVAHFPEVVVVKVAMHAALVASPGDVEVDAERDSELDRFGVEVLENRAHARSWRIGWSASSRIPSCARSSTIARASR